MNTMLRDYALALLAEEKILPDWAEAVASNVRNGDVSETELRFLADLLVDVNGPLTEQA